jgi:hypothetical protein
MGVLSRERDSGWHRGAGSGAATAASSSASDALSRQVEFCLILSCNLTGRKLIVKTHLQRVFSARCLMVDLDATHAITTVVLAWESA